MMDQMLRLLHACGLPAEDVDFINSDGKTMNKLLKEVDFHSLFLKRCYFDTSGNITISRRDLLHVCI